jgi:CRISPR-associated endonuclease/helicase Cas3
VKDFVESFRRLARDRVPYDYQIRVAKHLWNRKNLLLRAPTGAGKTLAVLAPFLHDRHRLGVRRLIYCLPLRSLAQGVYDEAKRICPDDLAVNMQTGQQPDDPFFALGDIIVTTYDQVLSGLLCSPYGQSGRQHNINAAALVGNLVVFDEFHLMEISRAFLTAVSCLGWFGPLTRSVWMTATATPPLQRLLENRLHVAEVSLSAEEEWSLFQGRGIRRALRKEPRLLTATEILTHVKSRVLVVVNRVARAQELYEEIVQKVPHAELLHARFFQSDRRAKHERLNSSFGPERQGPALAIATQVIEAGLDYSCEHLLTEICPMNALVQRAGRCARFPSESGAVHVYPVEAGGHRPYTADMLKKTWEQIHDTDELSPALARKWVSEVHSEEDQSEIDKHHTRHDAKCAARVTDRVRKEATGGVADMIRADSDTVRVMILANPSDIRPAARESIPLYRSTLQSLLRKTPCGWRFEPAAPGFWTPLISPDDVNESYLICLPPNVIRYTQEVGVRLGQPGSAISPERTPPPRPGYGTLRVESWSAHSKAVCREAEQRLSQEGFENSLLASNFDMTRLTAVVRATALLHDLGKLQDRWQKWAEASQAATEPGYRMTQLLAHTTTDGRPVISVAPTRPPHAAAGAYYAQALLPDMLPGTTAIQRAAILASILGHHGGWWSRVEVLPLHPRCDTTLAEIGIAAPPLRSPNPSDLQQLREGLLEPLLTDLFEQAWPLMSFLTRMLRLADRKATEETNLDA